jgi:hypothetical protein
MNSMYGGGRRSYENLKARPTRDSISGAEEGPARIYDCSQRARHLGLVAAPRSGGADTTAKSVAGKIRLYLRIQRAMLI